MIAAGLALLVAGCGPAGTPESQVRSLIDAGEAAAEARDLSALMNLVSEHYTDEEGRDRVELQQYVRIWLMANQSIQLVTRVESIEFPYRDMARVELTVGSLARESGEDALLDVDGDLQRLSLELELDDGDWKLTRARLGNQG